MHTDNDGSDVTVLLKQYILIWLFHKRCIDLIYDVCFRAFKHTRDRFQCCNISDCNRNVVTAAFLRRHMCPSRRTDQ